MRQYYRLLVLLGVVPIAALTASSVLDLVQRRSLVEDPAIGEELHKVKVRAEKTQTQVASDQPVFEKLAKASAVPYEPANGTLAAGVDNVSDAMQPLLLAWKVHEVAIQLVLEGVTIVTPPLPVPDLVAPAAAIASLAVAGRLTTSYEEAVQQFEAWLAVAIPQRESLTSLQQQITAAKTEEVQATQKLAKMINDRLPALSKHINQLTDAKNKLQTAKSNLDNTIRQFEIARDTFENQNYPGARAALVQCVEPLPPEVAILRSRTDFWIESMQLLQSAAKVLNDRKRKKDWDDIAGQLRRSLIEKYPNPHPSDRDQQQKLSRAHDTVRALIELDEISHLDLLTWIPRAGEVMDNYAAIVNVRDRVRRDLQKRLGVELGPPKTTRYASLMEARTGSNSILVGKFETVAGGEAYLYWRTLKEFRGNPNQPTFTVIAENLIFQPRKPLPLTCVEEYNQSLRSLRESLTSRSRWEDYLATCEKLQQELIDYAKLGGEADLDFHDEISLTQSILRQWEDIEYLLAGN